MLAEEKALTRQSDELARKRAALPWVRIDKDYRFDTKQGREGIFIIIFTHPPQGLAVSAVSGGRRAHQLLITQVSPGA